MQTYLFRFKIEKEEDGRWSAWVDELPGCSTWGDTREEAVHNIHDAVEAYVSDMRAAGEEIPQEAASTVMSEPTVAVTL